MRIAITGYGLTTAVGPDASACWDAFCAARTGIGENTIVPREGVMSDRAGQVRTLEEPDAPRYDRAIRLGERALAEAIQRAGIEGANSPAPERRGFSLGTALGGVRAGERFHRDWLQQGYEATNRLDIVEYPLHATADALASKFSLHGPRTVHSNACAAGAAAVANGYEYLLDGHADVVVAGGVDPLAWLAFGGFSSLGVLSLMNCAPYTRSEGITLGEGAGFLVLEPLDRAESRGATIFAELLGYGLTADAYHPTAPDPRGRGALKAMDLALAMGGLDRRDVDYVNGHGTGTPANDTGELKTIRSLGEDGAPISSTKSMIGHTLGAAGAVEAVVSVMTLQHQKLHPTYVPDDTEAQEALARLEAAGEVDIVARAARPCKVDIVLSNSFAFGGNNASLLFGAAGRKRPDSTVSLRATVAVEVVGVAGLAAAASDASELREAFLTGESLVRDEVEFAPGRRHPIGRSDDKGLSRGLNPRSLRRFDRLSKLAVQAVHQVIADQRVSRTELANTGLVFATSTGPLSTVESFQRGLIVDGDGDSKLFPNTVMNAAGGHIAMTFGMRGPTATVCAGGTSGVSALHLGQQLIRNGSCSRVIVVAADEANEALLAGYASFPGYLTSKTLRPNEGSGVAFSEAAVAVMLAASPDATSGFSIVGMGLTGDGPGAGRIGRTASAWQRSFELALERAGIEAADLDAVISAACGHEPIDGLERAALVGLNIDARVPVVPAKAITGDLQSASPLLGLLVAQWLVAGDELSVAGHRVELGHGDRQRYVLVSGYGIGGSFQSYVVRG